MANCAAPLGLSLLCNANPPFRLRLQGGLTSGRAYRRLKYPGSKESLLLEKVIPS